MNIRWLFFIPLVLFANPKGAKVVSGEVNLKESGNQLEIHTGERAVVHWDHFSIQAGESTHFVQPGANSAVLNRVMEGITQIDGMLQANGRVYLLNPRGIVIGKEGVIDASGFVASTLDFSTEDFFKNGDLLFKGASDARLINLGKIKALGGDVFLLAKAVLNEGAIEAPDGVVGIAAASEILLKPSGVQRLFINFKDQVQEEDRGIDNKGVIQAAHAELRADGNAYRFAINHEGTVEATGLVEKGGRVFLVADGGSCITSGSITAPSGTVQLLGDQVGLEGSALVDVSGPSCGGEVLIGGDFQGDNPKISNATMTVVQPDAKVLANAMMSGDGGRIICWSDDQTFMLGSLSANAGVMGGDGGFIEISGREGLSFFGMISTLAPEGKKGALLLDPSDVTISGASATAGVSFDSSTGVYTPTAANAVVGINMGMNTLPDVLNNGSTDVTITTRSSFTNTGDIIFDGQLDWTSDNSLTLIADGRIFFDNAGGISNTSGGSLTAIAGDSILVENTTGIDLMSGDLRFKAANDISIMPQGQNCELKSMDGIIEFVAGRDIWLGDADLDSLVTAVNGAILLKTGRDFLMLGNRSTPSSNIVSVGDQLNIFDVGRDLSLLGNNVPGTIVNIGGTGDHFGNMVFNVGRDVLINGGTVSTSIAQIGFLRGTAGGSITGKGDITFTSIGGSLSLNGGSAVGSFAQIGHGNTSNAGDFIGIGDITINNVFGPISIQGNQGYALIGHGNSSSSGTDVFRGDIAVSGRGGMEISANASAEAGIGFLNNMAGSATVSGKVTVSDDSLIINGSNLNGGNAYIGAYSSDDNLTGSLRLVQVNVRDNLILNAGTAVGSDFDGAAAIGAFSTAGGMVANVEVNAGNLFMNARAAANTGLARILTSGEGAGNGRTLTVNGGNLYIGNGVTGSAKVQIISGGPLTLSADDDIIIRRPAQITNNSRDVALVVDADHPSSPESGGGRFVIEPGSLLNSAGALRIFTAERTQNRIEAPLNGATFVPGAFLVDSPSEQWGTYFSSNFGGFPFTIFYKTGLPQTYNAYGRAIAEMLLDLKDYDDLLYTCKYFLFGYDRACYDQHLHPKGMLSSFDLFPEEVVETMLRPKYRSTHTKFVESF